MNSGSRSWSRCRPRRSASGPQWPTGSGGPPRPTSVTEVGGRSEVPIDGRPIGVFDSGLGGLTVLRALVDLLPSESTVYFGDTGRFPYGPKPADDVLKYALEIGDFLVDRD